MSMAFPIGSMGLVYLPMYIWLIFMVNVGKYTSLMDPMGMAFYPDSTMTSLKKTRGSMEGNSPRFTLDTCAVRNLLHLADLPVAAFADSLDRCMNLP